MAGTCPGRPDLRDHGLDGLRWTADHADAHTTPNPTSMPSPDWVNLEEHRHALAERDQERQATAAPAWWCRARPARVKRGTSWLLVGPRAAPQR